MTVTLCLSRSSDAQPEVLGSTLLGAGFLYASYQHLLWTPTHQGFKPLRSGVAFLTTSRLQLPLPLPDTKTSVS